MGRPPGSGEGLEDRVNVRLPPELGERLDAYAEEHDLKGRPAAIREILTRTLAPKGAKG